MNSFSFDKKNTLRTFLATLALSLATGTAMAGMATENINQIHNPTANKYAETTDSVQQPATSTVNTSTTESLKNIFYPPQKTVSKKQAPAFNDPSGEGTSAQAIRRLLSPSL
ncbi:MAG: hypothetical protein V7739_04175 [Motiliproteus sp.]